MSRNDNKGKGASKGHGKNAKFKSNDRNAVSKPRVGKSRAGEVKQRLLPQNQLRGNTMLLMVFV